LAPAAFGDSADVFDHVTIRVSDRPGSERFYDAVLAPLGREKSHSDEHYAEWDEFSLGATDQENPVTRRLHVAFAAPSRELVDEFWRVGVEAGYRDDGPPGPRPQYSTSYYGAFLLDPDGNSVEAVHHDAVEKRGMIDHLWIRVLDLGESVRFYEAIAPYSAFSRTGERPGRVHFTGSRSSFGLVEGEPTEHVHVAFPATANEVVDAFHRAALDAGYRDNGAPGERPVYHAGYYGAFVLDPDGNNVEVVCHNR
jgi:catechol 2,3-dioxygenase-like lactoylglutathione lyase family enzyme